MPSITRTILHVLSFFACVPAAATLPLSALPDWQRLEEAGLQAYGAERYQQAELSFSRALNAAQQAGVEGAPLLAILNNLASTYTQLGQFAKADQVFERLRPLRDSSPNDPATAHAGLESDVNHAALTLRRGRPREAQQEFERALAAAELTLESHDLVIARICNHLALIYRDNAQYGRAREVIERALAIRAKAFGPESAEAGASISVLAQILQSEGDYPQAESLCRRALSIRRKAGPWQPSVAESLNNLGTILRSEGHYTDAENLYKEALSVWNRAKGPGSYDAALAMNNLAALYQQQGKQRKAEAQFRQAVSAMEQAVGPSSPSLALLLANFSSLYRTMRKWDRADALLSRALTIDEQALGPVHPRVAEDLSAIAQVVITQRDWDRAEALLLRALSIHKATAGPESDAAAKSSIRLALFYQLRAQPAKAAPYYEQAMANWKAIWKVRACDELDIALGLESYAVLLKRNQQFAEAEAAFATATGIRVQAARNGAPKAFPRMAATGFQ